MNEPDDPIVTEDIRSVPADALDTGSTNPPESPDATQALNLSTNPESPEVPPHQEPTISRIDAEPSANDEETFNFLQPSALLNSLGRLGHYEVLDILGRGGCGVVFRAFDDRLQRVVAIKVMAQQIAMLPTARRRFVREARSSAAVRHKNVVQVYEVAEQPLPYLVMEFIPGETLQQKLKRSGPLDVSEVLLIGREIAEGLSAAHANGLIHRDIKPGNVLIEEGPPQRIKITDFGLARASDDASISQSGQIIGTPMFMAPEQALGHELDQRADLFSLGSVLYQMVTGCQPFQAPTTLAVLGRVAEDDPRPIQEIVPETPKWLCEIIAKLHAKNPDERGYQTARELADVLAECEVQLQAQAKNFSRILRGKPQRSSRWKWAIAAAILLPVLALSLTETIGVTHLFRGRSTPTVPSNPGGEPTLLVEKQEPPGDASIDVPQPKKQTSTEKEKPIEKKPAVVVAEPEENPFKKATVGDFADYKMTYLLNGQKFDGKTRIEVTAKTEKTAKIKTVTTVSGQGSQSGPELEIDLAKPYDPTKMNLPPGAEKVDSGTEKIKIGGKEYETSWLKFKFKSKNNGFDVEVNTKFWMAKSAPLGGLVKMEVSQVQKKAAQTGELKITMEFSASGHRISPNEARNFASRGDWKAAAAAYARVFAAQPMEDGELGFEYAAVLVLLGDQPGYRRICAEMLQRNKEPGIRPYHIARAFTLAPYSVRDFALPQQQAEDELKRNTYTFWSLTEQGALAYRAGRYDEAAKLCEQSLKADGRLGRAVLNWLWLALVETHRGKPVEAQAWLEKATKWLEQYPSIPVEADEARGLHLHNWMETKILHREAERTLAVSKRLSAMLRGEDKPKDNAERLVFAQVAYEFKKFAFASQLWAEALSSDPKLAEDRRTQHRYNAACAASLAAAGQSKDEPPQDDAAKAKLRGQALDWLKAELIDWDKFVESGPIQNQPIIVEILKHWQKDSDLAGIRDAAALAKLPPEEQKAFTQLWADVSSMETLTSLKSGEPQLLKNAALQAWFGQDKELAAVCARSLKFVMDTKDPVLAERLAKICSLRRSDAKIHEAALVLARRAVELGKDSSLLVYFQMCLGMAEYRSGNYAAADTALLASAQLGNNNYIIFCTTGFYRAMSLFRLGKDAEARKLATETVAKMKPLPADAKNPLVNANADDLILWMAFMEARALLNAEVIPAPKPQEKGK